MINNSTITEQSKLPNLPGFYPFLNDGNLIGQSTPSGPPVLVMGTASGGPSGPVPVRSMETIASWYTTSGTLLKGIYEVIEGGAKNIVSWRFGASPAILTGVGSTNTTTGGWMITPSLADDEAGIVTKLHYSKRTKSLMIWDEKDRLVVDHSDRCSRDISSFQETYIGTGTLTKEAAGKYKVTDTRRSLGLDRTPWVEKDMLIGRLAIPCTLSDQQFVITGNGDTVGDGTGSHFFTFDDPEDTWEDMDGKPVEYRVGQPRTKCYAGFTGIHTTIDSATFDDATGRGTIYINGYSENELEKNSLVGQLLNPNTRQGRTFTVDSNEWDNTEKKWKFIVVGNPLQAMLPSPGSNVCSCGNWLLMNAGHTKKDVPMKSRCSYRFCSNLNCPAYNNKAIDMGTVSVSLIGVPNVSSLGDYDIGGYGSGGSDHDTPVPLESVIGEVSSLGISTENMSYTPGTDGTNLTKRKLFEHLWDALEEAKNTYADYVYVPEAYADCLNIKYCSRINEGLEFNPSDDNYPGAPGENSHATFTKPDVLGWCSLYIDEEGDRYYAWSNDVSAPITGVRMWTADGRKSVTIGTSDSDPQTYVTFHEVSFAYLIARYCHAVTRDDHIVRSIIPFMPPKGFSQQQVNRWIGRKPVYDLNGQITQNGRGLLGFPWTYGRTTTREQWVNFSDGSYGTQDPGFILTDGEFSDEGRVRDSLGHLVDIGKYLGLFGSWVVMHNGFSHNNLGYHSSGAGYAVGFATTLSPTSNFTGKMAPNVSMNYYVRGSQLSDLVDGKIFMFKKLTDGTLEFSDGPTASRSDSDYQRWTTMSILGAMISKFRAVTKPFIGESISEAEQDALSSAWDKAIVEGKQAGWIKSCTYEWIITPESRIVGDTRVKVRLVPSFELRRVRAEFSLAAI